MKRLVINLVRRDTYKPVVGSSARKTFGFVTSSKAYIRGKYQMRVEANMDNRKDLDLFQERTY